MSEPRISMNSKWLRSDLANSERRISRKTMLLNYIYSYSLLNEL